MMTSDTPISVIVPVHNRADLASQCLAALSRWTTPLEILVVDDGSTEPAIDLLRQAGIAHHWLRNPDAQGFSAAVNRGLRAATGDPLLLLNSDAEVTEGGDHAIRRALAGGPPSGAGIGGVGGDRPAGAVAARLLYPGGGPQWSGGRFPTLPWLFALASGLGRGARSRLRNLSQVRPLRATQPSGFAGGPVDWAPGAALAIARDAYAAVGPFDESYRHYAQDLDYCQRLAAAGRSVRVLADWTVVHHLGGSVGHLTDASASELAPLARPGATGYDGQRLDLLWLDLLHWARLHRGDSWARRARRMLVLGGRLRLLRLSARREGSESSEALAVAAALAALAAGAGDTAISAERGSPGTRSR